MVVPLSSMLRLYETMKFGLLPLAFMVPDRERSLFDET